MHPISKYLGKQQDHNPLISEFPVKDLNLVITIPCHNEPNLIATLMSIDVNANFEGSVEVIILINQADKCDRRIADQNEKTFDEIQNWKHSTTHSSIRYFPICKTFPAKKAGVGNARKMAMDEAARRLLISDKPDGIITGLDADALVLPNYLKSIQDHFLKNPRSGAASIHYEHPTSGNIFSKEIYHSIISYELHLRYFIDMQRTLNLPFAFQTIGSSMAVRATNYAQVGGMNRRQAGEDFYFLHKCIKQGGFTEINTTTVIPSPRISDRVPFGTGKAIGDMIGNNREDYLSYHRSSFNVLAPFINKVERFYNGAFDLQKEDWHDGLKEFLSKMEMAQKVLEVRRNASSTASFKKRFFHVFDAFVLMKYLHFMRDHYFADIPVLTAVKEVFPNLDFKSTIEALEYFRSKHLSIKIDG